jgi:hypothetical protein
MKMKGTGRMRGRGARAGAGVEQQAVMQGGEHLSMAVAVMRMTAMMTVMRKRKMI